MKALESESSTPISQPLVLHLDLPLLQRLGGIHTYRGITVGVIERARSDEGDRQSVLKSDRE